MELLKQLYEIHSPSENEEELIAFIMEWLAKRVPSAQVDYDEENRNLYITKGESDTYPCVVAHTDQVQHLHPDDFRTVWTNNGLLVGYSNGLKQLCGLGADDKNGVWVALRCLTSEPVLKVALFSGEEMGCVGSQMARMEFFDDCRFVLQADRRGSSDFITTIGMTELCTQEFVEDAGIASYGYREEDGLMTDVLQLRENGLPVCCANLSCGYYEPHTDREFTVMADLENCLELVRHIIHTCTRVYPAPADDYLDEQMSQAERDLMWEEADRLLREYPNISYEELRECLDSYGYSPDWSDEWMLWNMVANAKK